VEKRTTPVDGDMQLRRIPVALTRGWGGLEERPLTGFGTAVFDKSFRVRSFMKLAPGPSLASTMSDSQSPGYLDGDDEFDSPAVCSTPPAPTRMEPVRATTSSRPLNRLVTLQRADGSWDLTTDLAKIVGHKLGRLKEVLANAVGDGELASRAWATALAVTWLHANTAAAAEEWMLLERKATKWLERCPARLSGDRDWLQAAADLLV
jgi:hypothetical protein